MEQPHGRALSIMGKHLIQSQGVRKVYSSDFNRKPKLADKKGQEREWHEQKHGCQRKQSDFTERMGYSLICLKDECSGKGCGELR